MHDVDDRTHRVAVDIPTDGETRDGYQSVWSPHVFRDSFRRIPNPPLVYNHQRGSENVIGRAVKAESLPDRARLIGAFDDFGVKPRARRAFDQIRSGEMPGFSFEFGRPTELVPLPLVRPLRPGDQPARYLSTTMVHFAPVFSPAIVGAVATGLRSLGVLDPEDLARMAARFGLPAADDRVVLEVERQYRAWEAREVAARIDRSVQRRRNAKVFDLANKRSNR
jgi:hypothetical protein